MSESISIIMPAKNEATGLAELLPKLKSQFPKAEVIVVDDGSTDATPLIAGELASRDRRIRAISNGRNLGLGGSYKIGIREARGEYLFWVPADDAHPVAGLISVLEKLGETD